MHLSMHISYRTQPLSTGVTETINWRPLKVQWTLYIGNVQWPKLKYWTCNKPVVFVAALALWDFSAALVLNTVWALWWACLRPHSANECCEKHLSLRPLYAINFSDFTVLPSFLLLYNNDLITEIKAFKYFLTVIPQHVSNEQYLWIVLC